jgi:hypothetical protein
MRDVVLNLEDIRQIAVVAIRPYVPAGCSVGKLRANPDALASTADGTFEHRSHAKVAADGTNVDRAPLIGEARVARDHCKASDLRQVGDDVFTDAVGEILLLWIARHVGEW